MKINMKIQHFLLSRGLAFLFLVRINCKNNNNYDIYDGVTEEGNPVDSSSEEHRQEDWKEVGLRNVEFMAAKYFPVIEPPIGQEEEMENGMFEGDMASISVEQGEETEETLLSRHHRDIPMEVAIISDKSKWPKAHIPYRIHHNYTAEDRIRLAKAFEEFHRTTCIRFRPRRKSDKTYISIEQKSGCWSHVGKLSIEGPQIVSLDAKGCLKFHGVILHELMHAVGFYHEQSRYDRDAYVIINWENIPEEEHHNFRKYSPKQIRHLNAPYDYDSITHYGRFAYAKSYHMPSLDIKPRRDNRNKRIMLGQRRYLSRWDARKINRLYRCRAPYPKRTPNHPPATKRTPKTRRASKAHGRKFRRRTTKRTTVITTTETTLTTTRTTPTSPVVRRFTKPPVARRLLKQNPSPRLARGKSPTATKISQCFDRFNNACVHFKERRICNSYKRITQVSCRKTCNWCKEKKKKRRRRKNRKNRVRRRKWELENDN